VPARGLATHSRAALGINPSALRPGRDHSLDNVKVTLSLSRRSLDFFKREAKKRHVPYQRIIRALVDTYAERQAGGRS
jgi:hypothetical protein